MKSYVAPNHHGLVPMSEPPPSAIPKVVGILLLISGGLDVIAGFIGLLRGNTSGLAYALFPELERVATYFYIENILPMAIGMLAVYAGLRAIRRYRNAPQLAIIYAISQVTVAISYLVYTYVYAVPVMEKIVKFSAERMPNDIINPLITITWPIIVLELMTRPSTKAACSRAS